MPKSPVPRGMYKGEYSGKAWKGYVRTWRKKIRQRDRYLTLKTGGAIILVLLAL